ncbi:MAG: RIP metalloprotease RseP, partial [Sulfurimonas sp.]|nr:RIP metalloprotease RseP [Sulfurimonas sp.]
MSFLVSLLVLSALIFFHELGHYFAARMMGVSVEVFSIG